jgi:hypothetical protein
VRGAIFWSLMAFGGSSRSCALGREWTFSARCRPLSPLISCRNR